METIEILVWGFALGLIILGVFVYAKMPTWKRRNEILSVTAGGKLRYSTLKTELDDINTGKRPLPNQTPALLSGLLIALLAVALYLGMPELGLGLPLGLGLMSCAMVLTSFSALMGVQLRGTMYGKLLLFVLLFGLAIAAISIIPGLLNGEGWGGIAVLLSKLF